MKEQTGLNPQEMLRRLRQDRDAFGHMLMDAWKGEQPVQIIERGDGLFGAAPGPLVYFASFPDWPGLEREAMQYVLPGRSLDLGCGAGRALLYLQEQGMEALGIDNSPLAVEVCRQRGADARLLSITGVGPQLGTFANLLMLGHNWGLMGSFRRARWLLRRFRAITTPGARIIASTNNIYKTEDPLHLNYHAYNRALGRMSGQMRLRVYHKIYRSDWFDYLMVSQDEMHAILEGTGWRVLHFLEDPQQTSYVAVIERID